MTHDGDGLDDMGTIDKQILDCESQLRMLRAKKHQLKMPHRLTMSIDEAGALLGIGRNSAYAAAKKGQLPTVRIGKKILVPIEAFEKMLKVKT